MSMTEEKYINASAKKDKFADEILSDDELENVVGGVSGKKFETFGRDDEDPFRTTGKLPPPGTTGK